MIANQRPSHAIRLWWAAAALAAFAPQGLIAETVLPPMPTPSPQAVSSALQARITAPPASTQPAPSTAPPPAASTLPAGPALGAEATPVQQTPLSSKLVVAQLAPEVGDQNLEAPVVGSSADEIGLASWYGSRFHGRLTANGEVYDMNKLTAANKTLPFGTVVKVTNLENGKAVDVTINDRGPFVAGRIIDLSRAAAEAVGLTSMGVAKVRLHIVKLGDGARVTAAERAKMAAIASAGGTAAASQSAATATSTAGDAATHQSAATPAPQSNLPVILQLGAFHDLGNAVRLKDYLDQNGFNPLYEKSGDVTRVVLVSVPAVQLSSVRERLAKIGINSVLVRHE
ncbi:MAG TPA: septal ring lytic transglycosylase RlpA family protein [Spirochaetia bacterium]|nr:septal ring lytic transglycosylase RlpA family protein [Spirochaetia bacterium]